MLKFSFREVQYDLDDCLIIRSNCNYQYDDRLSPIVSAGYWPGNVSRDVTYLFSQDLLEFFDILHKFIPSLSTGGFIHTLEKYLLTMQELVH